MAALGIKWLWFSGFLMGDTGMADGMWVVNGEHGWKGQESGHLAGVIGKRG